MRYKALLIDLDDTILDFGKSEDYAISKIMSNYGIDVNEENKKIYSNINLSFWKKLERKEIKRDELVVRRFQEFFKTMGRDISFNKAKEINDEYFNYLSEVVFVFDGVIDILKQLKQKYKIYIITNGVKWIQSRRLALKPELLELIDKRFISEEIGFVKPEIGFINYVLDDIGLNKDEVLIIGDSLSSDIALGFKAGIDTCWVNRKEEVSNMKITYVIKDLKDLISILD